MLMLLPFWLSILELIAGVRRPRRGVGVTTRGATRPENIA